MTLVVDPELQAYIDPLTPDEDAALERSLLAEGCRDALVLWGDVLVDGHNRHRLCLKHGLPFRTVQNPRFQSRDDVHLWMIDQHLGRRSVSDFQRGVLALRKRDLVAALRERLLNASADASAHASAHASAPTGADADAAPWDAPDLPPAGTPATGSHVTEGTEGTSTTPSAAALGAPPALTSREALAKAARLSNSQVVMIEKIQQQAAPEVVAAVRAGTISINAAAAVASLPAEEQVAAAQAGAGELKLAARRVREAKRAPRAAPAADADAGVASDADLTGNDLATLEALRERVAMLTAENADLRRQLAEALGSAAA